MSLVQPIDPSALINNNTDKPFSLMNDAGLTPAKGPIIYDISIPEKDFVRFSSAHDASPGTMISILIGRAIDRICPDRQNALRNWYIVNSRPMIGAESTHHNCTSTVEFDFTERIKEMPFEKQCTVHRGSTFIQSDEENVKHTMGMLSLISHQIRMTVPSLEAKKQAYTKAFLSIMTGQYTYMVSYVGQWKYKAVSPYIREFWTHVPVGPDPTIEISAINGNIFLSFHQHFKEDTILKGILQELTDNGISYECKQSL